MIEAQAYVHLWFLCGGSIFVGVIKKAIDNDSINIV